MRVKKSICGTIGKYLLVLCLLFTNQLDAFAWKELNNGAASSPSPRTLSSMAFDPAVFPNGQMVLFGGLTINGTQPVPLNDTWVWNGTAWIQLSSSTSPPARFGASMAFDQTNHILLLFGGSDGNQVLNDIWVWNGSNSVQFFPAQMPSSRAFSSMTFDASIMQLVLFGGAGNLVGEFFGDTWLWTKSQPIGSTWLPVTTTSITNPAPRSGASMAFDEITQKPLLFGGAAGLQTFNDTWTLGQLPLILSLTPNIGEVPVVYKIYRDQNLKNLIAEIPSDNRLRFIDHNRKKGKSYSYFIVSVSDDGDISSPAKLTVEGCCRS